MPITTKKILLTISKHYNYLMSLVLTSQIQVNCHQGTERKDYDSMETQQSPSPLKKNYSKRIILRQSCGRNCQWEEHKALPCY